MNEWIPVKERYPSQAECTDNDFFWVCRLFESGYCEYSVAWWNGRGWIADDEMQYADFGGQLATINLRYPPTHWKIPDGPKNN